MKWIVDIKGAPDRNFEISVVRSDNTHGIASYGWHGPNKIHISSSGGPCNTKVPQLVWDKLVRVAEEVAAELNGECGRCGSLPANRDETCPECSP